MTAPSTAIWMRSFGYLAAGETAAGLLRFAAMVWVARALGPGGFGVIGVGVAVAGYVVTLHSGFETVALRRVAASEEEALRVVEETGGLRLVVAVVAYAGTALTVAVAPAGAEAAGTILIYTLSLFTLAVDLRWLAIAVERTRPVALAGTVSAALYLIGAITLIDDVHDLLMVPLIHIGSEMVMVALLAVWARRRFGVFRPRLRGIPWRPLFRAGAPLTGVKGARAVMLGFDVVLINQVLGAGDAGQYAAARRFAVVGMILVGLYYNAFLPRLVKTDRVSDEAGADLLRAAWRRAVLIMMPVGVLGTVFSVPVIELLLGAEYREAGAVFSVLVWSVVVSGLAGPFQQALIARSSELAALYVTVLGAAAAVGLALVLVPSFALIGAAAAAVMGEVVRLGGSIVALGRRRVAV